MIRATIFFVVLMVLCGGVQADPFGSAQQAVTEAFKSESGTEAISSSNPMTVSSGTAQTYTNTIWVKRSEFQSIGVTVASTVAIDATWVLEYSLSDGTDGAAINWHELASTSTNVTTATETAPIALDLPVCKIVRMKFGADQDATARDYTVTECVISRY